MLPFIIGGILILAGILVSVIIPIRLKNKNIEIQFMQTTTLAELKRILTDNAAAGLEGYRHYVEIKGSSDSDMPQKAPFSEKQVAYYDADLFQVYEESVTYTDGKGNHHQKMQRSESLISNQKSSQNVALKDSQTGDKLYIDVSQPGIQLEPLKTLDRFEPSGNMNKYGFFQNFQFGNMGARTLGFRMVEKTIPLGQMLYAIGEAWLEGTRILMSTPRDKKNPFIVSTRSEEAIVQGNKTGANAALVIGIILAVAGILVMIFVK
jgi:hypothetical protein